MATDKTKRTLISILAAVLLIAVLSGCGSHVYDPNEGVETKDVVDDTGREIAQFVGTGFKLK